MLSDFRNDVKRMVLDAIPNLTPAILVTMVVAALGAVIGFFLTNHRWLSAFFIGIGVFLVLSLLGPFSEWLKSRHDTKSLSRGTKIGYAGRAVVGLLLVIVAFVLPGGGTSPTSASTNPYLPHKGAAVPIPVQHLQAGQAGYSWDVNSDESGSCTIVGQTYHVVATAQGQLHPCNLQSTNFRNFTFEMNVTFLSPGEADVILRASGGSGFDTFYDLTLESFGYVYLYAQTIAGEPKEIAESLVPPNSFNRTVGVANTLAISMDGPAIDVFVNSLVVISHTDDTSDHGSLAVYCAVPRGQTEPTQVVFSAPRLWTW